jgi:O-antigen/teichoic acid export membrane protein
LASVRSDQVKRSNGVALGYVASSISYQASTALTNFLCLRWVSPQDTGIWQALALAQAYLLVLRFGLVNGMNREHAVLLGRGESEEAYAVVRAAQAHTNVISLVSALIFAVLGGFATGSWRTGAVAMAAIVPARLYQSYLQGTFRSSDHFSRVSVVNVLATVVMWASLPMVASLGYDGMCARAALVELLVAVAFYRLRPARSLPPFRWSAYRRALRTGVPLFISSYVIAVSTTFPRLVVGHAGGIEQLGQFTPAYMIQLGVSLLPSAVMNYLGPRAMRDYGRGVGSALLARRMLFAMGATMLLISPAIVVAWHALPPVINGVLPEYGAGIRAMQWSLIAGLMACSQVATTVFAVIKAWRPMFVYVGAAAALRLLGPYALVRRGSDTSLEASIGSLLAECGVLAIVIASVLIAPRFAGKD